MNYLGIKCNMNKKAIVIGIGSATIGTAVAGSMMRYHHERRVLNKKIDMMLDHTYCTDGLKKEVKTITKDLTLKDLNEFLDLAICTSAFCIGDERKANEFVTEFIKVWKNNHTIY